jgi:hypothetical protein
MNFFRCLAAVVFLLILSVAAHANLFLVDISTRTYSLNNRGEIVFHVGNRREFIDLVAQNLKLDAKKLVMVYNTVSDALEIVRNDDGSYVSTVMAFGDGTEFQTASKNRAYRQTFLTLSGTTLLTGTTILSGTASVSGTNNVQGSVVGPVSIEYDSLANIVKYRWDGDFQYAIPGDTNTLTQIVRGHFILGREVHAKNTP